MASGEIDGEQGENLAVGEVRGRTPVTKFNFKPGQNCQPMTDHCTGCKAHNFAFCSRLDGTDLVKFGETSIHKTVKAGQMLFSEYDDAKYFHTVVSGEVRLSRLLDDGRRQITGFKSAGDFVGLSVDGHYTADAEAIDDVVVCQFNISNLNATLEDNNTVQSRLMEMMQIEVIKLQNHMLLLGRKTPIEKVANFFCERAARKFVLEGSESSETNVEITLPMSRTDIADFLGLTIETVSRTITKLRSMGEIELISSQNVVISDLHRLQLLADGES